MAAGQILFTSFFYPTKTTEVCSLLLPPCHFHYKGVWCPLLAPLFNAENAVEGVSLVQRWGWEAAELGTLEGGGR